MKAKAIVLVNFSNQLDTNIPLLTEIRQNERLRRLASCRLQLVPIATALAQHGIETYAISAKSPPHGGNEIFKEVKLLIVSKVTVNTEKAERCQRTVMWYLHMARRIGISTTTIYSNHHLADRGSIWKSIYEDILAHSDKIVCPTKGLSEALARLGGGVIQTIEDPCTVPTFEYKTIETEKPINLLWYGNTSNIEPILSKLQWLLKIRLNRRISLLLLTGKLSSDYIRRITDAQSSMAPSWSVAYMPWTEEEHLIQLRKAHYTLLPCSKEEHSRYASHNRLLDAISGGTIPIATPIPSYQELSEVAVLSDHIINAFMQSIQYYDKLIAGYARVREQKLKAYSLENITSKWRSLLLD